MSWELLTKSFQQYSLLWLLLSAFVGGVIGSLTKFTFEIWLKTRLEERRAASATLARLKYPLVRAADALDRRLENFSRHAAGRGLFENDAYYCESTLYVAGCYFGWALILERLAFSRHHLSDRHARNFSKSFAHVFKSLTNRSYMQDFRGDVPTVALEGIPRFQLMAIGEQMINTPPESWRQQEPDIISFTEFKRRYRSNYEVQEAFREVSELFSGVGRGRSDAKLNRILVFATTVRLLLDRLDVGHRVAAPRSIRYLDSMSRSVAEKVWHDLNCWRFRRLVQRKGRLPWTRQSRMRVKINSAMHQVRKLRSVIRLFRSGGRKTSGSTPNTGAAPDV